MDSIPREPLMDVHSEGPRRVGSRRVGSRRVGSSPLDLRACEGLQATSLDFEPKLEGLKGGPTEELKAFEASDWIAGAERLERSMPLPPCPSILEPESHVQLQSSLIQVMEQSPSAELWKRAYHVAGTSPEQVWVQGRSLGAFIGACGIEPQEKEVAQLCWERAQEGGEGLGSDGVSQGLALLDLCSIAPSIYDGIHSIQSRAGSWMLQKAQSWEWLTPAEVEQTELTMSRYLSSLNRTVKWVSQRWFYAAGRMGAKIRQSSCKLGALASSALARKLSQDGGARAMPWSHFLSKLGLRLQERSTQAEQSTERWLTWKASLDATTPQVNPWRDFHEDAQAHLQQLWRLGRSAWGRWQLRRLNPSGPSSQVV